jgi:hypothetical protein
VPITMPARITPMIGKRGRRMVEKQADDDHKT